MDLNKLRDTAAKCELCDLCRGRNKPVFSRGNPGADTVICGMCPGPEENAVGYPFVGTAGKILDEILRAVFFTDPYIARSIITGETKLDDRVYITNLVKCFVPPGTKLTTEWMNTCLPYFLVQLNLIKPKVIIALGKDVGNFLLNNDLNIGVMRGKEYRYMSSTLICSYHPSYLARGGGSKHRHFSRVVDDFKLAVRFI